VGQTLKDKELERAKTEGIKQAKDEEKQKSLFARVIG